MKRRDLLSLLAAAPLAGVLRNAHADDSNLVRICVPYAAGGSSDVMARVIGTSMANTLKRNVIVENRPGASGIVGTKHVQASPPDGDNILFHNSGFVAVPMLQKGVSYDPLKDLSAVAMIGDAPNFLIVHESVPARTIPELVAYARTLPHGIECGNSGINSGGYISAVMLEKLGNFKILHVPFKGSSEVATALMSGEIKMQVSTTTDAMQQQVKLGKLFILGVATRQRTRLAPQVPAIDEFIPGYSLDGWYGFLAPAATPLAKRQALADAIKIAIDEPGNRQRLESMYLDVKFRGPEDAAKSVSDSVAYYQRMIDELGLVKQ